MSDAPIFWFTGLSGSGKSTIAAETKKLLAKKGFNVLTLDGDDVRERLHVDLGFSREDIIKNNSLIVDLCIENRNKFDIILVPIISPYKKSRKSAKQILNPRFYEVYFKADVKSLIKRDPKGLYAKAINGELKDLIGFSETSPYDIPKRPDKTIETVNYSIDESVKIFHSFIESIISK
jgi:adenylylsulfate kinase